MSNIDTLCNETAQAYNEHRGDWSAFDWPMFNACETVRSWTRSGRLSGVYVALLDSYTRDEAIAFLYSIGRPQPHETQNALRDRVSAFFDEYWQATA